MGIFNTEALKKKVISLTFNTDFFRANAIFSFNLHAKAFLYRIQKTINMIICGEDYLGESYSGITVRDISHFGCLFK